MRNRLVDSKAGFRAIYSIYKHEYLGILISSHVVQELENGNMALIYQGLYPKNFAQFSHRLDDADRKLVKLVEEISPKAIVKRFGPKAKSEEDFFLTKFKDAVQKLALDFVSRRMGQLIPMLKGRQLYTMGNDGYPARNKIEVVDDEATVLFHFRRNDQGTMYFPTVKLRGEKVDFQFKGAELLSNDPAWMMLEGELFHFHKNLEGQKLKAFLNRWNIKIPPSTEETYYAKFVTKLIERYDVFAKGFEIVTLQPKPQFLLKVDEADDQSIALRLEASYGAFTFPLSKEKAVHAVMEKTGDNYRFFRVVRDVKAEKKIRNYIDGLQTEQSLLNWEYMDRQEALSWLSSNVEVLEEMGVKVTQDSGPSQLNFDTPEIQIETVEEGDWFDVKAVVKIGAFSIPFIQFKSHILLNKRDYTLPDGTIAILPESWFTDYRHLLEIAEERAEGNLGIRKYQAGVLGMSSSGKMGFQKQIQALAEVEEVGEQEQPQNLKAELRSYQKKGYDWLGFLREQNFGGILADDMGLGKTLQALSLILREKEKGNTIPSLIVMPTSLIYNWEAEAKKFTPGLKTLVHTGFNRTKDPNDFTKVDMIFTTYGLVRQDLEMLKDFPFYYIILDESQVIKNPSSKTSQAVKLLRAHHRLSLSGTPLENTLMDLWSQMSFLNPGMLGSEKFFKDFYVLPIEKGRDVKRQAQLKRIINPFILRRTKEQVATELPPKVEQVYYCEMSEAQEKLYEETKNSYRNMILDMESPAEFKKNKFTIFAGLQKLRQIAIHPNLVEDPNGKKLMASGKYEQFRLMLDEVIEKGSKVLVFSQFVKLLTIIRKDLEKEKINYAYLDGSTKNRQQEVERFQTDEDLQVFLISLKAGGVGLNLTAADYVFILDPWWNPAVERQAIDRTHRIGQEKTVFSFKFITRNSIEEKIVKLQERKAKLSDEIVTVEETIFKSLDMDELKDLLT